MKSEKAELLLQQALIRNEYLCTGMVTYKQALNAIELAEQEAEERMRLNAQKAFCYNCSALCFKPQECNLRQSFIQKLNEE